MYAFADPRQTLTIYVHDSRIVSLSKMSASIFADERVLWKKGDSDAGG